MMNIADAITCNVLRIIFILSLICEPLTCIIICRYRNLRQNTICQILLNWFQISFISMLTLINVNFHFKMIQWTNITRLSGSVEIVFFGIFISIVLLTLSWYLNFYHPDFSKKYDENCIYFICALDVILLICSTYSIFIREYLQKKEEVDYKYLLLAGYLLMIVVVIPLNVIHILRKKILGCSTKRSVAYIFTNVYLLFIHLSLITSYGCHVFQIKFLSMLFRISVLLYLSYPIIFFLLMYKYDKYFNSFMRCSVTCRRREDVVNQVQNSIENV